MRPVSAHHPVVEWCLIPSVAYSKIDAEAEFLERFGLSDPTDLITASAQVAEELLKPGQRPALVGRRQCRIGCSAGFGQRRRPRNLLSQVDE